ncbi:MAG TPA: bifunctional 3-phosphoshikimate 1-carboxyvinyltransferase/cytidylate kinase [Caldimonas sp.]|nr:bifunctional 3-phosphoshikimate 1-carboxyvinyltransferase/cytidylate kinase [Caldimonas sp.]
MYTTRFVDIPPLARIGGSVRLPGSKSISNRVLLLAALCAGATRVRDLLDADDTRVMREALARLGVQFQDDATDSVLVTGLGDTLPVREAILFLGNAGTAMRPLTAALAVLAARHGGRYELGGVARMHERPIGDLVAALRSLGCGVEHLGRDGYPPLRIEGPCTLASSGTPVRVRGDVSSQFLSALLMALPLLRERAVTIEVEGELISRPYVEITLALMARFGVTVRRDGWARFSIPAGSAYRSPGEIRVEGDASAASYFIAAAALAATDAPLRIVGAGLDSIQGDIRFVDAARAMGAVVDGGPGWVEVRRGRFPLAPIALDARDIPDAAMTLAPMALFADGRSRIDGIASWRVKETDRIAAVAAELRKLGATVEEGPAHLAIEPPAQFHPATIATYDDHRMAMCMALAAFNGARLHGRPQPVRILDPRCVAKTFPDYFETLFALAVPVPGSIPVITIDGPSASGKGTLASAVARALGYHYLDSGALYRATALAAQRAGIGADDEVALARIAAGLDLRFDGEHISLSGVDATEALRAEHVGVLASQISALPAVRAALRDLQLSFRRLPGLVADGRDMGTVVFPDAPFKVYLTASASQRAERRLRQLSVRGVSATLDGLRADLEQRDARDQNRAVAPLRPAEGALLLDNSALTIEASVAVVLEAWEERRLRT